MASLLLQAVTLCFVFSVSVWGVKSDWGEWSTWSGCGQNEPCRDSDVTVTSTRRRSCKTVDSPDCEGPETEGRDSGSFPTRDDHVAQGDEMATRGEGCSNSTTDDVGGQRSCVTNRRPVRSVGYKDADSFLSLLQGQRRATSHTGAFKLGEDYHLMSQFLNSNQMNGSRDDVHSPHGLNPVFNLVQNIPKEDNRGQEINKWNRLLRLVNPTGPVKTTTRVERTPSSAPVDDQLEEHLPSTENDEALITKTLLNTNELSTQKNFLELVQTAVEDVGKLPYKVDHQHLEKIASFMDTLQETMDQEKLAENINYLNEILRQGGQPWEGASTKAGTSLVSKTASVKPRTLPGEDLIGLIDGAMPTRVEKMRELEQVLVQINEISNTEESREALDRLNDLLDIVKIEGTPESTEASASTEASTSKRIADGEYLLEFLNKTERINQSRLRDEFKTDLAVLDSFLAGGPSVDAQEIFNSIKDLVNNRPMIKTTMHPETIPSFPATTYISSDTAERVELLDVIKELKNNTNNQEDNLQHIEDLLSDTNGSNKDMLRHEIQLLDQLLNPSSSPRKTTALVSSEVATVLSTKATEGETLDFVDEIAGLALTDDSSSKEQLDVISDIFEWVKESDGDALGSGVQQLIKFLSPSIAETTAVHPPTTASDERSTFGEADRNLLDVIENFKQKVQIGENRLHVHSLEKLFDGVQESNQDMLNHEIDHLNQLLNPTSFPQQTNPVGESTIPPTMLSPTAVSMDTELPLLKVSRKTTEAPSTEVAEEEVLDFVNEVVGMTGKERLYSKQEIEGIYDILQRGKESDENVLDNEVHLLLNILQPTSVPFTSVQISTTLASETLPTSATVASLRTTENEEESMLNILSELKVDEVENDEDYHQQMQGLQKIYQNVHESNQDVLVHEIDHLNQLLNPKLHTQHPWKTSLVEKITPPSTMLSSTTVSMDTTELPLLEVSRKTTEAPSTEVADDEVLDFLNEVVGMTGKERLYSKQEIEGIYDILQKVKESDENVLDNEVHLLLNILQPTSVPFTSVQTSTTLASETLPTSATIASLRTTEKEGETMLNILSELKVDEGENDENYHQQMQGLQKIYQNVHESNQDVLVHEIDHLNQLLNPKLHTQHPWKTSLIEKATPPSTMLSSTTVSMDTTELPLLDVSRKTTEAPSTEVAEDEVLDFMNEVVEMTGKERLYSKQEIEGIHDILQKVKESDENVLDNEVHLLLNILQPTSVPFTSVQTSTTLASETLYLQTSATVASLRTTKKTSAATSGELATTSSAVGAAENVLTLLDDILAIGEDKMQGRQELQDIQDVLKEVHEPDEDVLADEIERLKSVFKLGGASAPTEPLMQSITSTTIAASEASSSQKMRSSIKTYQPSAETNEPSPHPTIVGKYILEFLQKVEKTNQNRLKSEFEDDVDLVGQFLKTSNLHVGEDLVAVISDLLRKNLSTGTPIYHEVETVYQVETTEESQPTFVIQPSIGRVTAVAQLETQLPVTPEPENHPLLDLIETLGKTKDEVADENRHEVQNLGEVLIEEGRSHQGILSDELERLNTILNPEILPTSSPPLGPLNATQGPRQSYGQSIMLTEETLTTTIVPEATPRLEMTTQKKPSAGERFLELIEEASVITGDELRKNQRGMEAVENILKFADESGTDILDDEVNRLIAIILPEGGAGSVPSSATRSSLGPTAFIEQEAGVTYKEGTQTPHTVSYKSQFQQGERTNTLSETSEIREETVTELSDIKENGILLDILSSGSTLQDTLVPDAEGMRGIVDLVVNLTQVDAKVIVDDIAKLLRESQERLETTQTYQMPTEHLPAKHAPSTYPELTTVAAESKIQTTETSPSTKGDGEDFLDTLRELGDKMKMDKLWGDIALLEGLSQEERARDEGDQRDLEEGMEFVWDIMREARATTATSGSTYSESTAGFTTAAIVVAVESTTTSTPTATAGSARTVELRQETDITNEVGLPVSRTFRTTNAPPVSTKTTRLGRPTTTTTTSKETTSHISSSLPESSTSPSHLAASTFPPPSPPTPPSPTPFFPVDRWTEWSPWGPCSSSCGLGEQSRSRECRLLIEGLVIPASSCEGSRAETMTCETRRCPVVVRVDGRWSGWSAWTECSAACGRGERTRYRLCDSPEPAGQDGLPCEGAMTEDQDCIGETEVCQEAGVEAPTASTPKSTVNAPTRRRANKTVAVVVMAVFVVVVTLAFTVCLGVKLRRTYGRRRYRAGKAIFEEDSLPSSR